MQPRVLLLVLLVCAMVASCAAAAVDTLTLFDNSTTSFSGVASDWDEVSLTYSGAGPLVVSFGTSLMPFSTAPISITADDVSVTFSNSGAIVSPLFLTGSGSSLSIATGSTVSLLTSVILSSGTLTIPATSSLFIASPSRSPGSINVAGTLSTASPFSWSVDSAVLAASTIIRSPGITLTTTSAFDLPAGGLISSDSLFTLTAPGGSIDGTLSPGPIAIMGVLSSDLTITGTVSIDTRPMSIVLSGSGNLVIGDTASITAGQLSISASNSPTVTIGGVLSSSQLIVNAASATSIVLSAASTCDGPVSVSSGATGATILVSGALSANGLVAFTAPGPTSAVLLLSPITTTSPVQFLTDGTISIGSSLSASNLNFVVSPSVLDITGTLNLALFGTFFAGGAISISGTVTASSAIILTPSGAATISIAPSAALSSTGFVSIAPGGSLTLVGSVSCSGGINLNAGADSTISGQLISSVIGVGAFPPNPFGSVVYSIGNGATLKADSMVVFNSPTVFSGVSFVTPQWSVSVSGGSSVGGPTSAFSLTSTSNAIDSRLFPMGTNTNCVWVQGSTSLAGFSVSLPGNIQYRNWVQASSSALAVTSTNNGAVTLCAPNIQSTLDRRSDPNRSNLVYFGGNVIFTLTFSQALPFGTLAASDFTVVGGVITSITNVSSARRAVVNTFQIVVQITCDGVVSLAYNGSWTGNGTYLGEVTLSNSQIVSAKCLSNIHASCS